MLRRALMHVLSGQSVFVFDCMHACRCVCLWVCVSACLYVSVRPSVRRARMPVCLYYVCMHACMHSCRYVMCACRVRNVCRGCHEYVHDVSAEDLTARLGLAKDAERPSAMWFTYSFAIFMNNPLIQATTTVVSRR